MSIKYVATSKLPTPWGVFAMHGFEDTESGKEHVALTFGTLSADEPVLGRIHSECLTGDALFSLRCDCGFQLQAAMQNIAETGSGFILYLRQEGRGIGLLNKIRAYELQDKGANTVEANEQLGFEADMRKYDMIKPMLEQIGVKHVRLMTNNPRKVKAMKEFGIEVVERVPLQVGKNRYNEAYLKTKSTELGHMMSEYHFMDENK
ncbi:MULTISPECIES: GTP cyclohydrolase II [Shewanella]|jgi:GTP cyclohydrolase II|uniref:GTP cyclohydrolase-2 n=6 Tax=Shewanella TaxID=22 RepID=RIBA_SHEB2|nr:MULTISPECIES: GTP cyclohydrolase II [Shewanella]A6WLV9.1 RecName: Full=GTP cyclohydrolase-2; AltName: Full=GTP cyclohydrolase II [Shewanella baltica OS185]A9KXC4.1 RecName: Full=GTP cyclohydrolase-2; AltName: Full=GTP cyclohydrolase II [Shewanella baltica OS195]B8EF62.1 RecName: Full=GTP cyclohydrolase-2; AltName: Full=GTP cyclohydrolase II [Shewanella baltica OS223]EGT3625599.1 GTP cyclohydrolase II [Morganella morganii]ABS07798.1 GTP cyclohydrolase II [Shewanella baltica OS185]ABX48863.1